ncbi:MAG TPA: alpha/beta hydrolase [Miltoncostaeaceae bacterium]|nr:alpha/beta hydrolase [Miltoncostaeaceae bacterium]
MSDVATMELGEGPAVLLVHGLNGFKEGWGPLPRALADGGHRVIAVDLPGFGASRRLRRTGPETLAEALGPLVERHAPVDVVAHSLGTQVATALAAGQPARVRRVALVSPWVTARPRRLPPRRVSDVLQLPLVGRPLGRLAIGRMRRDPERRRQAYRAAIAHPDRLAGDPGMAALLELAADRLVDADLHAMADWAASGMAYDVRPLAARMMQPALVVGGDRDRVTPVEGALRLVSVLPGGRMLRLPGVGHFPHLEAPDAVLPAIAGHLA